MTDSPEAVMARVINPTCWNYGDLPRVQDEVYLAGARGEANRQAREMHAALRAAGFAIVPREPTAEMLERMWGGEGTARHRYYGLLASAEATDQ